MIQVISEKTMCSKGFTRIWEKYVHESNCNYYSYGFSYKFTFIHILSFLTHQEQESGFQQVGDLVTRNILFFVYSESHSTSKPCRVQQTFINKFSYMLFLFVLYFQAIFNEETDFLHKSLLIDKFQVFIRLLQIIHLLKWNYRKHKFLK